MKRCPCCGQENPDDATVCVIDQKPLDPDAPVKFSRPKPSRHDIRAHLIARPREVKSAVVLLAGSQAVDLVHSLLKYHPVPSRSPGFYLNTAFEFGIPAFLLYFIFRGKNWARWVARFLTAVGFVTTSSRGLILFRHWEEYFYLLIDIGALVLLFKRPSNERYTEPKSISSQPAPAS
jgi:hypothetical protein